MVDDGRSEEPREAEGEAHSSLTRELRRIEELCTEFYESFEARSIERMEALWSHSDLARCIHPGWEPVVGWTDVRQSWVEIFREADTVEFEIIDSHFEVSDQLAFANLVVHAAMATEDEDTFDTMVVASNVFERRGANWTLLLHHSSYVLDDEEEEGEDLESIEEDDPSPPN